MLNMRGDIIPIKSSGSMDKIILSAYNMKV